MADTIRDVVIRIGIQQRDFKAVVPDYSAWIKGASDAATAVQAEFSKVKSPLATGAVEQPSLVAMDADLKKAEEVRTSYRTLFDEIRQGFQAASTATESVQKSTVQPVIPPISGGGGKRSRAGGATSADLDFAQQQLAELDKVLSQMAATAAKSGKEIDRAMHDQMKAMRDVLSEEIRTSRERIAIQQSAAEKFKEIQKSERLAVVNRTKDQESILAAAQERFKNIAASERLAAYRRGQESERAKEVEEASKRIEAANKRQQASFNIVAESTRAAGEGAFRAARGFVLLTASTDDLQAWLDKLRLVQGGWDVFSGGLSTIQHVSKALKALTDAGGVWVFVATNAARAQQFLTATFVATRTAAASLSALMGGPVVATLVAAVAVWGVATYAMGGFSKQANQTEIDLQNLVTAAHILREELHRLSSVKLNLDLADELANIQSQGRSFNDLINNIDERASLAQREINKISSLNLQDKLGKLDPSNKADKEAYETGLALMKSQEEFQRRIINLEKESVAVYKEQQSEIQRALDKQEQLLAVTKAQLDQERQRVQTIQEQIGRLNEVERIELKRLIDKRKSGGKFDEAEVRRFEQLGGQLAKDEASKFFAAKGAAQADEVSKVVTGKTLTGTDSVFQAQNAEFQKQSTAIEKQRQEVADRTKQLGGMIATSLEQQGVLTIRLYEQILKPMQVQQQRLESLERSIQQLGVGRHVAR